MSGIEVEAMIIFFIVFVTGALIGVVAIVSFAYRREDRLGSLPGKAPGAMCRGARRLTGVGTIGPVGPERWAVPAQRSEAEDGGRTEAR